MQNQGTILCYKWGNVFIANCILGQLVATECTIYLNLVFYTRTDT